MNTTTDPTQALLDLYCQELKLPGLRKAAPAVAREPAEANQSHAAFLVACLAQELTSRREHRLSVQRMIDNPLRNMSDHTLKAAIDGAYSFQEDQQRLLDRGSITEDEWFINLHTYLSSYYLAATNPRGQSGHGGDEVRYRYTQEMVLPALHKSGAFIDIGCANGYLLEKLVEWTSPRGISLEVYGLDISPEMIKLARHRLPLWTDRFYVGNALFWRPPRRYDFVCVRELNYVPRQRRRQLFEHLLLECVSTGGRLILGPRTEERSIPGIEDEVRAWGYPPTGLAEKPHQEHAQLVRRLFWFSAPQA